jgi:hypothetical protein
MARVITVKAGIRRMRVDESSVVDRQKIGRHYSNDLILIPYLPKDLPPLRIKSIANLNRCKPDRLDRTSYVEPVGRIPSWLWRTRNEVERSHPAPKPAYI